MMKHSIILILLIVSTAKLTAQDKAIAKIHYIFKHINDTSRRDIPLKDDVVSYLGKQSYYYTTLSDQRMKKEIEIQKSAAGFDGGLTLRITSTPILEHYLITPTARKTQNIQCISSSFDAYLVEGDYEAITWSIQQEEKKIGNYTCQKATTEFGGRSYTAWFTSELPFPFGPWKLHGLPGLILEANDEKQEVTFEYAGFDTLAEEMPLVAPSYVLPASKNDFNRLRHAFQTNKNAYYKNLQANGKMDVLNNYYQIDYSTMHISFVGDSYKPSTETNNPIELDKR